MLNNREENKYMRTTDQDTIGIVTKMFEKNQFIRENIMGCPSSETKETESLKIKICNINKYPEVKKAYQQWK